MSERLDIAIGILDTTENAIEKIKNQHKFEKDLSEFLNTNTYSKDKKWVFGMLNQVSEECKKNIDTLIEKDQRIAELEEQLKNLEELNVKFIEIGNDLAERNKRLEEQLKNKQEELDFSININRNKKRLYNIWVKINKRCFNNSCEEYKNYGGRGITICKEWQRIGGFYSFVIWSLNNGYNPELTIDRINNDGNYEPNNCRWVTRVEQNNNTRKNRFITAFGETDTLSNMARKYNVNVDCLWSRLNAGWNVEKALSTKIQSRNFNKAKLKELQGDYNGRNSKTN